MATTPSRTLWTHLQKLVVPIDHQTADRELLRRFSVEQDEAAFAEIVRRHGPMLLRVCRRVLRYAHDSEDICQAAFLLLAQKAASIRWRDSVAGWLFQTAYRLSLKARATAHRRKQHESQPRPVSPPDPVTELSGRELQAVLDEEVNRLPEKYRAPILLCCLEGQSRDEAAYLLGWDLALVKYRLERGRERLRARLAQRGVLLGVAITSAWLLEADARAGAGSLAPQVVARAALSVVTGQATLTSLLPARIAALAKGVGSTMFLSRMTVLALFGLVLVLGAAGLWTWLPTGPAPVQAQAPSDKPTPAEAASPQPIALPLTGHKGPVYGIAFAPDGKTVAASGSDKTVRVWDVATGQQTLKLDQTGEGAGVAFAPDGKSLAASSRGAGGEMILWDAATGKPLWRNASTPPGRNLGGGGGVAFAPDGGTVVAGMGGGMTVAFQAASGKMFFAYQDQHGGATAAAYSSDGNLLAIGDSGGAVHLLDRANGRQQAKVQGRGAVTGLAFLPGGTKLAVVDKGRGFRILDASSGAEVTVLAGADEVNTLALSSDGKRAATSGKGGDIRLWNVALGKEERRFEAAPATITALAFAPDGERLATADRDGAVVIWDLTKDEKPLPKDLKLTEKELNALWADLAGDDVVKAHTAARMLRADPARSVPFLKERLKPRGEGVDAKKVKQLITDLDSDAFETREKASQELEKLGKSAESALRAALAAEPSAEAKKRLEKLLGSLGGATLTAEQRRDVRAVRVLEQAGTVEARSLLEVLTRESPGWWVTQEAKAALERLALRDKKP